MTKIFNITRDENAYAGYSISKVTILDCKPQLIISYVSEAGPAFKAGMRSHHTSWEIIYVNGVSCLNLEEMLEILESTKIPNCTFTIEIQPLCIRKNFENSEFDKTTYTQNMRTGDLYNIMWAEVIKDNPKYEKINNNSFRHAILACTTVEAQERIYQHYLNLEE